MEPKYASTKALDTSARAAIPFILDPAKVDSPNSAAAAVKIHCSRS
ncbi:Uncharacterised protein [Mycobacteroides abscessus subsp. abscessus]|nr:Uncharacterised protein [Mycobacteroides abscessus subsp. abscessus]